MRNPSQRFAEAARGRLQDLGAVCARYELALLKIRDLPKTHAGAVDEEDHNMDTEDAFINGCEVGTLEGYQTAADIARAALKVPVRARR